MTAANDTSTPILAELHCHSQFLGWQHFSRHRLEYFFTRARHLGVSLLAFTEHANIKSYWKLYGFLEESAWRREGMTILTGAEITVQEGGDILVYGPPAQFKELPARLGGWPAGRVRPPLERLLEAVEALDLMKVGAHPLRQRQSLRRVPPELLGRLDALELNAREFARQAQVAALAAGLRLPLVGGSDAHFSRHLGRVLNRLPGWVKDMPTLRQAVRNGQVEVLHRGLRIYPPPQQGPGQDADRSLQAAGELPVI